MRPSGGSADIRAEVGARLREERKRLGFTQVQIAERTGVSIGTQVGYERGAHIPGLDYLEKLRRVEVNVHYVQTGKRRSVFSDVEADWDLCSSIVEATSKKAAKMRKRWSSRTLWSISRMAYDYFEAKGGKFDAAEMERMLELYRDIAEDGRESE